MYVVDCVLVVVVGGVCDCVVVYGCVDVCCGWCVFLGVIGDGVV